MIPYYVADDPERALHSRPNLESAEKRKRCGGSKRKPSTDRSQKPCSSDNDRLGTMGKSHLTSESGNHGVGA